MEYINWLGSLTMLFAALIAVRSTSGRYSVHIFAIANTVSTTKANMTILNMIANTFKIFSFRQAVIEIFITVKPQIDNVKNKKIPTTVFNADRIMATRPPGAIKALLTATAANIS